MSNAARMFRRLAGALSALAVLLALAPALAAETIRQNALNSNLRESAFSLAFERTLTAILDANEGRPLPSAIQSPAANDDKGRWAEVLFGGLLFGGLFVFGWIPQQLGILKSNGGGYSGDSGSSSSNGSSSSSGSSSGGGKFGGGGSSGGGW